MKSRLRRGLVLGKFMPPHAGHIFLCETASHNVDELTVLACSTDAESIPGELRASWLRSLLPRCRIVHMHRDIPQEPSEHPQFWDIWRAAIREIHPQPLDAVFGSEQYIHRLAQELWAQAVIVDPDRELFAVSGTEIRTHPQRHWPDIPGPVRTYFQKRICVLGPESSGKSILAKALAEHFQTRHMPEYGRTYDAVYRKGNGWTQADFIGLARIHVAMRRALAERAGYLLFEDTDALQTLIWSRALNCPLTLDELLPTFEPADLYLVLSPEVGWTDDGTRYFEGQEMRKRFFDQAVDLLREQPNPFEIITGDDWSSRSRMAVEVVSRYFSA